MGLDEKLAADRQIDQLVYNSMPHRGKDPGGDYLFPKEAPTPFQTLNWQA